MSSEIAIRAEGLSKRYRIGATRGVGRYRSLREDLSGIVTRQAQKRDVDAEFWALRDVSFEIAAGETVGIIGRNGAGKSTLLKILARITSPTAGRGQTVGRVASLLEVGTGFHPELTGRENIQLSGAVMGMRSSEVSARFDDIVEFSGLAKFLDTPVKRYSSGMYMRLAFSVAAYLEPEILLVDEVLAVGDAEFQKRCLGRMEDLSGAGRTVVFVSHSMASIIRLCPRVLLLEEGALIGDGSSSQVVQRYLGDVGGGAERTWDDERLGPGDDQMRLSAVRVVDDEGRLTSEVDVSDAFGIEVDYVLGTVDPAVDPMARLRLSNADGVVLFVTQSFFAPLPPRARGPGLVRARCHIPAHLLAEGVVYVSVRLWSSPPPTRHGADSDVVAFNVTDHTTGTGVRGTWTGNWLGVVRPMLEWSVSRPEDVDG